MLWTAQTLDLYMLQAAKSGNWEGPISVLHFGRMVDGIQIKSATIIIMVCVILTFLYLGRGEGKGEWEFLGIPL